MSSCSCKKLRRFEVGGLPLIEKTIKRIGLREMMGDHLELSGREAISSLDVLMLLIMNLAIAKDPLYELAGWVDSLDLRPLGFRQRPSARFTDDRFARALDKLYWADRASLQTRLVLAVIQAYDIQFDRIHNDSTSVKACGDIPGRTRTGFELRRGYSKDHRPDLKQLVFSLSISADGSVPIHHQVYPGNRNDETTHIETWDHLCKLHGGAGFLYVADCKLCTHSQLAHIAAHGGRAITVVPGNLNESRAFIEKLRAGAIGQKNVWRRPKPNYEATTEYFSLLEGSYRYEHGGYPIYWFRSSEKRKRDRHSRQQRLLKAEADLETLAPMLNTPRLAKQAPIRKALAEILKKYNVEPFIDVRILTHLHRVRLRPRGRPPGQKARYRIRQKASYSLQWHRKTDALRAECRVDGVFPLLCIDEHIRPVEVLKAWKYQPRLEKRFEQFKQVHRAAPLLFKKIERIEANMFVFFIALIVQALLERSVRNGLKKRGGVPLKLYPEDRDAPHPTTSQIFKTFAGISRYAIEEEGRIVEEYRDDLKEVHRTVIELMGMEERHYWTGEMEEIIPAQNSSPNCGM